MQEERRFNLKWFTERERERPRFNSISWVSSLGVAGESELERDFHWLESGRWWLSQPASQPATSQADDFRYFTMEWKGRRQVVVFRGKKDDQMDFQIISASKERSLLAWQTRERILLRSSVAGGIAKPPDHQPTKFKQL